VARLPFHATRQLLRPGCRDEVRRWAAEMNERSAEVRETLAAEGIALELVLYEECETGDRLYFVMQCEDLERAVSIFLASTMPVDLAHRAFLERCVQERAVLEVLNCHYRDDEQPVGTS
jgi:hypothetical protein